MPAGQVQGMTSRQQVFVIEYLKDFNALRAAREAGYKNPMAESYKLLDPEQYPLVAAKVKAEMDRRENLSKLTSNYVKGFIFTALDFCPGDYFKPGGKGGWEIDEESYKNLPREIKRLIEETEFRQQINEATGKTTTTLWVRFVSKTAAMNVAAKYTLTQKIEANVNVLNWDDLYDRENAPTPDQVEEKIKEVERRITVTPVGEDPVVTVDDDERIQDEISKVSKPTVKPATKAVLKSGRKTPPKA